MTDLDSLSATSRFLMQATLGVDLSTIKDVKNQAITPWLEQQISHTLPSHNTYFNKTQSLWRGKSGAKGFKKLLISQYGEENINGNNNEAALPYNYYLRMAWWHKALSSGLIPDTTIDPITEEQKITEDEANKNDLVRQRIALALSEILVVSDNSILENNAESMASYYDLLYNHAFDYYDELLVSVSTHPCMGVYLTHINNVKADQAAHIHPDENYARELLQLFTIGLYMLNNDGSRKKDDHGRDIPTYNNHDIQQLARVFTGIKSKEYRYEWNTSLTDGKDHFDFSIHNGSPINLADKASKIYKIIPFVDMVSPMIADEQYHDTGNKTFLNNWVSVNENTQTLAEINLVVKRIVAHPNTAPFIAKKLIQQLVTSNPTPEYIDAVASKFGTRGDLKATIREIFIYPLTNKVSISTGAHINGNIEKLKSPTLRVSQILRAFKARNTSNRLWLIGDDLKQALNHHPMSSPTVFNFYKANYSPKGAIQEQHKVAPEFELVDAHTSISYVNMIYDWLFGDALPLVSCIIPPKTSTPVVVPELDYDRLNAQSDDCLKLDLSEEIKLAADKNKHIELIERVSVVLTGKTNLSIKDNILNTIKNYDVNDSTHQKWIAQSVVFMVAISPEFCVLEH